MLKRHGYKYVLVDSIYIKPKRDMRWEELRYRPYLARYGGAEIIVVRATAIYRTRNFPASIRAGSSMRCANAPNSVISRPW